MLFKLFHFKSLGHFGNFFLADFRAPDTIRFGLSPLFLRFIDVWDAMDALADILETKSWDKDEYRKRAAVT